MSQLLGQGGFGCVLAPPLPCANEPTSPYQNEKYISKLMTKENADEEARSMDIIQKLDPSDRWHLPIVKSCPVSSNVEVSDCKVPNVNTLLYYPRADMDLLDALQKRQYPLQHLLPAVLSLFEGLWSLSQRNLVHKDVKLQNVLCRMEKDRLHLYLADYGIMQKISEYSYDTWMTEEQFKAEPRFQNLVIQSRIGLTNCLLPPYPFHPPEAAALGIRVPATPLIAQYNQYLNERVGFAAEFPPYRPIEPMLLTQINNADATVKRDYIRNCFDVFGLGCILYAISTTYDFPDRKIYEKLMKLAIWMTFWDVRKRVTLKQAYSYYYWNILKKYQFIE